MNMTMNDNPDRVAATWERIKALLERERQQILEEIRAYPTPIPRCDQQFNHLIERRELLGHELARLDAAAGSSTAAEGGARLGAYIDSCPCLAADLKLRLQTAWREEPHVAAKTLHAPGA